MADTSANSPSIAARMLGLTFDSPSKGSQDVPPVTDDSTIAADYFASIAPDAKSAPQKAGEAINAFGMGALETGTLGTADEIIGTGRGVVNTIADGGDIRENIMRGVVDTSDEFDAMKGEAPVGDFMGQVAGAVAPASAAGKAGTGLLRQASKTPYGERFVNFMQKLAEVPASRIGSAGVAGGAEAGITATMEGEDVADAATTGALFGIGGQTLLGEFAGGLYSTIRSGTKATERDVYRAEKFVEQLVKDARFPEGVTKETKRHLAEQLVDLGPEATIADMDDALYKIGIDLAGDRIGLRRSQKFNAVVSNRIAKQDMSLKNAMSEVLDGPTIMTPSKLAQKAKTNQKRLSEQYTDLIDNAVHTARVDDVASAIDSAFGSMDNLGNYVPASAPANAARKKYKKLVVEYVDPKNKYTKVDKDGSISFKKNPNTGAPYTMDDLPPMSTKQMVSVLNTVDGDYKLSVDPFSGAADKGKASSLASFRGELRADLGNIQGYDDIAKQYAYIHNYKNGYEFGEKSLLNDNADWSALDTFITNATDEELVGLMEGARFAIQKKVNRAGGPEQLQRIFAKSTTARAKLDTLFGPEMAKSLLESVDHAAKFGKNDSLYREAVNKGASTPGQNVNSVIADLATAGASIISPQVSSAAGLGAARRTSDAMTPRVASVERGMGDVLSRPADQAGSLEDLLELSRGNIPEGFAPTGAAIGAGAGAVAPQEEE